MEESPEVETLEQVQARHRKEQRDLVSRITSKKKNATKKTRKGVNDECAELERQLKERQAEEVARVTGATEPDETSDTEEAEEPKQTNGDAVEGVTTKLNETSISEAAPPAKEAQAQQQQQGGGKKRNRQKERLARRAAEQEEAAVKAEEEAANMTDHRGIEKKYMTEVFRANSLVEKDIRPDGHCLFSAVADQLRQQDIALTDDETEIKTFFPYQILRRAAATWMEDHREDFEPFLEEEDFEGYVTKIRDTAEWGGNLELAALAGRYKVDINVVQDGRTWTCELAERRVGETPMLWLAFYRHGYGLGEHYNSLRKATTTK